MKKKISTRKKQIAAVFGICLAASLAIGITTFGATEHWNDASTAADSAAWVSWKEAWSIISDDYELPSITVGATESQLNFAWYSHTADLPKVRFSKSKHGLSSGTTVEGTNETTTTSYSTSLKNKLTEAGLDSTGKYYANKVTISSLEENTTYYYQIYQNGAWGDIKTYVTKDFDEYSFLYVADPQIGACNGQANSDNPDSNLSGLLAARNDAYNWNDILTETLTKYKNISFIISAGDQVNTAKNEYEYSGFLYPEVLSSVSLSTAIGNHDSGSYNYSQHFNNPNTFDLNDASLTDYTTGHTAAGSDYYYTYGDVLYIVIDTNNYNCATHENVIAKAVSENENVKWKIVTFHQDIYGSGNDHSDSDGIILRTQLTPIMDKYGIDVVLQGHDHTYSRTYQLTGDGADHTAYDKTSAGQANASEFKSQNLCYNLCSNAEDGNVLVNPKGTVYFEQNSATGSKFYNLIATQQDYIAERSQTWTPTYSIINVTEKSLTITTYDATTNEILAFSSPYTIIKEDRNIEYADITYENSATYTGNAITPAVVVSLNETKLTADTDYTVAYSNNTKAGTATITITGIGNYTGTISKEFTITSASIANRNVKLASTSYSYSGNEQKPAVTINGLTSGKDFSVAYSSNVNVGTANVTIKGIGNYNGTVVKTFTINKCSIASKTIKLATTKYTYDGAYHKPAVTISGLTLNKDYTVTYNNTKEAGTATVTINGKGNYTGTVVKTFTVNKCSITSKTIKLATTSYTYDGNYHKPAVTISGLTLNKDYTVTYNNTKEVGTATVTINGKGNYTGSVIKTFTVKLNSTSTSLTAGKKMLTVSWSKVKGASGYEVYVSTSQNGSYSLYKTVENSTKTTLTSLKSGAKYYVKVRAYRVVNGVKVYSNMSSLKNKTIK